MESLDSIGSRLGLDPEDIQDLKRDRRKWKVIFWVTGVIVVILSFIVGFYLGWFVRKEVDPDSGYPYASSTLTMAGNTFASSPGFWSILPLAFFGFLTGMSSPIFGQAVKYGVFNRRSV